MLEVSGLTVTYGGTVRALSEVSVRVPERGVLAVLGSNGAGKTTLLRAGSGTLGRHRGRVESGTVTIDGRPARGWDAAEIVRRGVVQVPEGRRIFGRLTVEENLRVGAAPVRNRAAVQRARRRVAELFPVLATRRGQRAALLSGGEQQMLAIGRALMSDPKLLLLDEPSLGLAPMMIDRIGEIVAEIHRQGTAVVLVEQNAGMALSVAETATVLDVGRVSLTGSAAALAATDQVQRLYLGHDVGGHDVGGHDVGRHDVGRHDDIPAEWPGGGPTAVTTDSRVRTLSRWQG